MFLSLILYYCWKSKHSLLIKTCARKSIAIWWSMALICWNSSDSLVSIRWKCWFGCTGTSSVEPNILHGKKNLAEWTWMNMVNGLKFGLCSPVLLYWTSWWRFYHQHWCYSFCANFLQNEFQVNIILFGETNRWLR